MTHVKLLSTKGSKLPMTACWVDHCFSRDYSSCARFDECYKDYSAGCPTSDTCWIDTVTIVGH